MRPTVDQLHNSGRYALIESFKIDDMNQFLMRELGTSPKTGQTSPKNRSRLWLWFILGGMGLAGGVVGYFVGVLLKGNLTGEAVEAWLWQAALSVVALFLLLPIHEFIHGLAFKRIGAPKVGYGYSLKSLMVYAYSQNFPATTREVAIVAILPFLIITTGLLIGWSVWPQYGVFWALLGIAHTSGCIGDFVLINYHRKNQHRIVYTYDDVEGERMTYFFEEIS